MSDNKPFSANTLSHGIRWILVCVTMFAFIAGASAYGFERWACALVIAVFFVCNGLRPFIALGAWVRSHERKNVESVQYLQTIPIEKQPLLAEIDAKGEGTALGLIVFINRQRNRMEPNLATDLYIQGLWKIWQPKLDAVRNTAEQSPVLGFASSLWGMAAGVRQLATVETSAFVLSDLYAAMEIMLTSSLIGAVYAFVCIGLAARLTNTCDGHEADLRNLAARLEGGAGNVDPELLF
ncbi:MAG: hypothetical protein Aurels2KO_53970 [Aureliella sp.]